MRAALLVVVGLALPAAAQADLTASMVVGPATGAPGAQVNIAATLRNAGTTPVGGELRYTYFISSDRAVTISDLPIETKLTSMDLQAMQSLAVNDPVTLPMGLTAGQHWIGVCVNFDSNGSRFVVTEPTYSNNCAQDPNPVIITAGPVTILTPSMLPPTTQYAPFGLRLEAQGGNGSYQWSLEPGSTLPPGLRMTAMGDISGSPTIAGPFSFTVKVTSGTSTATATLSGTVAPGSMALAVVDQDLPSAEFGRFYEARLVAAGGKPPYVWSRAPDTVLPPGLGISFDGALTGRPTRAGSFTFGVQVTDGNMAVATRPLSLRVTTPTGLHVAIPQLETAFLQRDYAQPLTAVGGKAPYTWTVTSFQSLPQDATEVPGAVLETFPEGFGLAIDGASLRGVPRRAGMYAVTLRVTDSNSGEDTTKLLLKVSYADPIAIVTLVLPDAFVASDYVAKLSHNRQVETGNAVYSMPCVQVPSATGEFTCQEMGPKQRLPAGLELREDGTIIGQPHFADEGAYSFLVAVTDPEGRRDVRSLSIRLRPAPIEASGCSGAGFAAPSLLLSLFVLAGIRRKRATP